MVAFQFRMPAGIPGAITRAEHATVEPGMSSAGTPFSAYALPAKLSSGVYVPVGAGDAATAMVAIIARPYPTQASQDALGTSTPPQGAAVQDFLKRGYMMVKLNGGATVVKGGQVYIRVAAASGGKPIGGFEGASDSTNTVAPAGLFFTGAADANGNVEVAYNI